jgi:magnesium transporter
MKKHQKMRSKKTGMEPGSLVHVGEIKVAKPIISLFKFDSEKVIEDVLTVCDTVKLQTSPEQRLWVNVHGLHNADLIREVGETFKLHPLVLEDILNTDQRPKVESYGEYLFIVTRHFYYDAKLLAISSEQISLVLGRDFLLTFQERATGSFEPVRERLRVNRGHIREQGTDYLAYALLDVVVDRYFNVLEQMSDDSEALEELLLQKPSNKMLRKIHLLKRASMDLRRAVWPLREMLNMLIRDDKEFFQANTILHLRDVYDHTVHFTESLEGIRDLLAGMMDIYLSSVSNRVNMEVRALTVVTMLFMPATLISGIFGMNFDVMPWLKDNNGFWWAIGTMLTVASSMGLIFWRRQWLSRS